MQEQIDLNITEYGAFKQRSMLRNVTALPTKSGNAQMQLATVPAVRNNQAMSDYLAIPQGHVIAQVERCFDWIIYRTMSPDGLMRIWFVPSQDLEPNPLQGSRNRFNTLAQGEGKGFEDYRAKQVNKYGKMRVVDFVDLDAIKWVVVWFNNKCWRFRNDLSEFGNVVVPPDEFESNDVIEVFVQGVYWMYYLTFTNWLMQGWITWPTDRDSVQWTGFPEFHEKMNDVIGKMREIVDRQSIPNPMQSEDWLKGWNNPVIGHVTSETVGDSFSRPYYTSYNVGWMDYRRDIFSAINLAFTPNTTGYYRYEFAKLLQHDRGYSTTEHTVTHYDGTIETKTLDDDMRNWLEKEWLWVSNLPREEFENVTDVAFQKTVIGGWVMENGNFRNALIATATGGYFSTTAGVTDFFPPDDADEIMRLSAFILDETITGPDYNLLRTSNYTLETIVIQNMAGTWFSGTGVSIGNPIFTETYDATLKGKWLVFLKAARLLSERLEAVAAVEGTTATDSQGRTLYRGILPVFRYSQNDNFVMWDPSQRYANGIVYGGSRTVMRSMIPNGTPINQGAVNGMETQIVNFGKGLKQWVADYERMSYTFLDPRGSKTATQFFRTTHANIHDTILPSVEGISKELNEALETVDQSDIEDDSKEAINTLIASSRSLSSGISNDLTASIARFSRTDGSFNEELNSLAYIESEMARNSLSDVSNGLSVVSGNMESLVETLKELGLLLAKYKSDYPVLWVESIAHMLVVISGENGDRIYNSNPGRFDIEPLSFASAEYANSTPHEIWRIANRLVIFTNNTIEYWDLTGSPDSPIEALRGTNVYSMEVLPNSRARIGDVLYLWAKPVELDTYSCYSLSAGGELRLISYPQLDTAMNAILSERDIAASVINVENLQIVQWTFNNGKDALNLNLANGNFHLTDRMQWLTNGIYWEHLGTDVGSLDKYEGVECKIVTTNTNFEGKMHTINFVEYDFDLEDLLDNTRENTPGSGVITEKSIWFRFHKVSKLPSGILREIRLRPRQGDRNEVGKVIGVGMGYDLQTEISWKGYLRFNRISYNTEKAR